jgi:hypothetical protein
VRHCVGRPMAAVACAAHPHLMDDMPPSSSHPPIVISHGSFVSESSLSNRMPSLPRIENETELRPARLTAVAYWKTPAREIHDWNWPGKKERKKERKGRHETSPHYIAPAHGVVSFRVMTHTKDRGACLGARVGPLRDAGRGQNNAEQPPVVGAGLVRAAVAVAVDRVGVDRPAVRAPTSGTLARRCIIGGQSDELHVLLNHFRKASATRDSQPNGPDFVANHPIRSQYRPFW